MFFFKPNLLLVICVTLLFLGGCGDDFPQNVKLEKQFEEHFKLLSQGNVGAARIRLRQHLDKHGNSPQPLFLMGLSYHNEKRYAKAIEWFNQAVVLKDTGLLYPPTWHFLGWSYFYQGDLQRAKVSFETFLELHPNESDSVFALGLIALEEGRLDQAGEWFQKAIEVSTTENNTVISAKANSRLGDVYEEQHEFTLALKQYDIAISLNPDLYETLFRKFNVLKRLGRAEEAPAVLAQFTTVRDRVRPDLQETSFPE